jgi:hypothetical protein
VPTVRLTPHLRRFFADLPSEVSVEAATVRDAVAALEARWPGLGFYVTDEQGMLRQHVAVFLDGRRVEDRALRDAVAPSSVVHIVQALSGG